MGRVGTRKHVSRDYDSGKLASEERIMRLREFQIVHDIQFISEGKSAALVR
jgi:hypothetical protein